MQAAADPVADIVLGQQEQLRPCERVRLMLLHPQQLGQREALQRRIARDCPQQAAQPLLDLPALLRRARVIPENGGTQRLVLPVQQDEPVHLAGEADALHPAVLQRRRCRQLTERFDRSPHPILGILLAPARLGACERIFTRGFGGYAALPVDEQRLDRARAQVNPDNELRHGRSLHSAWT